MVGSMLVYQAQTGVPHWPFASCHQGCLARLYLSRRMINLLQCFHKRDHPICLNFEFCLDLQWCFSSCILGTTSTFSCSMACLPLLTWKSHLMHQVPLALVPTSAKVVQVFMGFFSSLSLLSLQKLFPVVIAAHVWDLNLPGTMFFFIPTTKHDNDSHQFVFLDCLGHSLLACAWSQAKAPSINQDVPGNSLAQFMQAADASSCLAA